jgi:hypothetical protein
MINRRVCIGDIPRLKEMNEKALNPVEKIVLMQPEEKRREIFFQENVSKFSEIES